MATFVLSSVVEQSSPSFLGIFQRMTKPSYGKTQATSSQRKLRGLCLSLEFDTAIHLDLSFLLAISILDYFSTKCSLTVKLYEKTSVDHAVLIMKIWLEVVAW